MSFQKYLTERVLNEIAPAVVGAARLAASNPTVRSAVTNYAANKFKTSITNNHSGNQGKYNNIQKSGTSSNGQVTYNHNTVVKSSSGPDSNQIKPGNTYNITNNYNQQNSNTTTPIYPDDKENKQPDKSAEAAPDNKDNKKNDDENKKDEAGFFEKSGKFTDKKVIPAVGKFSKWLVKTTENQLSK